jgi:uncharacterized membrane protein (UPF0136 family)
MFTPFAARIVLSLYALLLAAGGVMGFVKARSRPSLIAGVGSAVVALIAMTISLWQPNAGLLLAAALALCLCLFFNYRFVTTSRKFMPAGLIAVVSLIVLGWLILVLV